MTWTTIALIVLCILVVALAVAVFFALALIGLMGSILGGLFEVFFKRY